MIERLPSMHEVQYSKQRETQREMGKEEGEEGEEWREENGGGGTRKREV